MRALGPEEKVWCTFFFFFGGVFAILVIGDLYVCMFMFVAKGRVESVMRLDITMTHFLCLKRSNSVGCFIPNSS